jgi:hypothetical protein
MNEEELYEMSHKVIPSCEQLLRRKLSSISSLILREKHSNGRDVSDIVYKPHQESVNYLNHQYDDDQGYVDFHDKTHDRHIYVVDKQMGYSKVFHEEHNIHRIFDVIRPCSNHEHSTDMTPHMKRWFIINIKNVCLQMYDCTGNIAIFCHMGRSRSPMYVVAYIILFCNKSLDEAMLAMETLLDKQRHQLLDRHNTLYEIVACIAEEVYGKY